MHHSCVHVQSPRLPFPCAARPPLMPALLGPRTKDKSRKPVLHACIHVQIQTSLLPVQLMRLGPLNGSQQRSLLGRFQSPLHEGPAAARSFLCSTRVW